MATILVVDDNQAVARMLARLIEVKGHRALVANSGAEALVVADRRPPPDLILLDLSMPEMDGIEVLRRLNARARAALPPEQAGQPGAGAPAPLPPVIFFSAVDDPAVISAALQQGAREYWIKAAFRFDDLPKAIERYLTVRPAPAPEKND